MFFNLAFFVILLPACVVAYAIVPKRFRWLVLLAFSWACIYHDGHRLVVFPLLTTASVYLCGLWMARILDQRAEALKQKGVKKREVKAAYRKRMRVVVAVGVLFNLGLLFLCKYLDVVLAAVAPSLARYSAKTGNQIAIFGMPPGISFYTFMAISYMVEVYRETVPPEHNPAKLALYISFFPQILEGPISRYNQTSCQLMEGRDITRESLFLGVLRMLWGFAKKLVVADRLNEIVDVIFTNYRGADGCIVILGAVLYVVQLYCDFSGTIDVALGSARIFGVELPENFRQPFFSRTASEFWQRWHITLGAWLKDYVYYPVSLSGPCKRLTTAARKRFGVHYGPLLASSVALLAVWVSNGVWHGAGLQYLCFGLYYFVLITLGGLIEPAMQSLCARREWSRDALPYRIFQTVRTLLVVVAGELIFRATSMADAIGMLSRIPQYPGLQALNWEHLIRLGFDQHDCAIVCAVLMAVLVVGVLKERGHDVAAELADHGIWVHWAAVALLILVIVVFGAYGYNYTPVDPMYANF